MAPPPHLPVQCSKTKTLQGFGSLLGYLPFLLTLLIGGGIVICYCMAVAYGHVEAAFPYIRYKCVQFLNDLIVFVMT